MLELSVAKDDASWKIIHFKVNNQFNIMYYKFYDFLTLIFFLLIVIKIKSNDI